jgi:hypothetical protein
MAVVDLEERESQRSDRARQTRKAAKLSDVARALLEPEPAFNWPQRTEAPSPSSAGEAAEDEPSSTAPRSGGTLVPRSVPASDPPRPSATGTPRAIRPGPAEPIAAPSGRGSSPGEPLPSDGIRPLDESEPPSPVRPSRLVDPPAAAASGPGEDANESRSAGRTTAEPMVTHRRSASSERVAWAPEVAGSDVAGDAIVESDMAGDAIVESGEASYALVERRYVARDATSELLAPDYQADANEAGIDADEQESEAWGGGRSLPVFGRVPQSGYASDGQSYGYEYEYEEPELGDATSDDEGEDEDEDEDEDGLSVDPDGALIEAPHRRAFYHHSSSDDDHHRRRRQRDRDPESNSAFGNAAVTMTAFTGLALFMILLVTIAIVAGAAAIIKENQESQPGNPKHVPVPVPAPQPGKRKEPPVGVPPIGVPVPVPPIVPVPVPPPVPPVAPVPPPAKKPAPRRPVTKPPTRRPAPRRPPTKPVQKPKPKPKPKAPQPQLPYCMNTKVEFWGDLPLPFLEPIEDVDPAAAFAGVPGVCRADPGSSRVAIAKLEPNPGSSGHGHRKVTLDVARRQRGATATLTSTEAPDVASIASSVTADATSAQGLLTSDQQTFGARLVADTGLNEQFVEAWMYAEENGSNAQFRQQGDNQPNSEHNNDWLNIGYTGNGDIGTSDSIWSSPLTAADATAGWLEGKDTVAGYSTASPGIQAVLATVGKSPQAQIAALQNSGWAGSGYPDLPTLYEMFAGVKLASTGAGTTSTTGDDGGELTKAELTSELPTLTQADFKGLTTQDLVNALPQLEAALNGTTTGTTGSTVPVGDGPARVQRMLAAAEAVIGSTYNQGNHPAVDDTPAEINQLGTDCSGFVSYLMGPSGADLWSQSYVTNTMSEAPHLVKGPGTYVTIRNNPLPGNSGHVFIEIEGHWFEDAGGVGVRVMTAADVTAYDNTGLYTQTFHPAGM